MNSRLNKVTFDRGQLLLVVFFILGAIVIGRLFYLQILEGSYFDVLAADQHKINMELLQSRGEIYMHDFKSGTEVPVVVNKNLSLIYAVPKEILNPRGTAKYLANILKDREGKCNILLDDKSAEELINKCSQRKEFEEELYNKFKKEDDPYEPVAHKVENDVVEDIKKQNLDGIYFEDEWIRYYPEAEVLGQVTGFLGFRDDVRVGQYGLEGYFQEELAGQKGKILADKDLFGRLIAASEEELVEAKNGDDIVLTLDKVIQNEAYNIIKQAVEDYGAQNGSMIVMDPYSGEIRAMTGYPSFDPNKYGKVDDIEVYKNLNVAKAYEPGSIFKVITMAAGLDSGAVEADTMYEDKGFVKLGKYTIHNADNKKFGKINMTQVLENSVNSGAMFVVRETGKRKFRKYVEEFGFGKQVGIGLDSEATGDISSLSKRGEIYSATASYGQGLTVTPLQMVSALATIVNNGNYVKPRLIDKLNGKKYLGDKEIDSSKVVISTKTSQTLKAMLVSVVKNGHGSNAQVNGYYIGGKTGTAEIASVGGYGNENIHSFLGFGPLENTKFVILVKLERPKWGRFSSVTAAPTFQKMANFLLQYYQIPPEYDIE